MTTSPPEAPTDPGDEGPRVTAAEVRDLGRLRRSVADRTVAGVAGGLARHLDVDPVILRVAFVVLAFFGGAGLVLYAAAWALVPEEGRDRAAVDLDDRSRTVALVALGVLATLAVVGDSWGAFWFPWPLVLIGVVVGLVWVTTSRRRGGPASAATDDVGDGPAYPERRAPAAPRPPDPRRRGPVWFWFTLALIVFSLGVLAMVDLAGVGVVDSAYPALAVGVVAVMLLVGSTWGRAGGLILLGLVASLALIGSTLAGQWDGERIEQRPGSAAEVASDYTLRSGRLLLDLSEVGDVERLGGRTIDLDGQAGRIEVVVPEDLDVEVTADVDGPGGYDLFGVQGGGIDWTERASHDGGEDVATLTIDARLAAGEITVTTE